MKQIVVILFYLLFISCSQQIQVTPVDTEVIHNTLCGEEDVDSQIELAWCNYLLDTLEFVDGPCLPVIYEDLLIYVASHGQAGEDQKFYIYNKNTGEQIRLIDIEEEREPVYFMSVWNDYLIVRYSNYGIDCFELPSFNKKWGIDPDINNQTKAYEIFEDFFVVPIIHYTNLSIDSISLCKFDIVTGKEEKILSITKDQITGRTPKVHSVKLDRWVNNDLVVYFGLPQLNTETGEVYRDFWAYNISQKEYSWKIENIDENNLSKKPAVIYNDVIATVGHNLYGFNKYSGTPLYTTPITQNDYGLTGVLQVENMMYVKGAQKSFFGANIETGQKKWVNNHVAGYSQNILTHHDGRIYLSGFDHKLFIVETDFGNKLYELDSPFKYGDFFISGQVIDEETGLVYAPDGLRMLAFKIPE